MVVIGGAVLSVSDRVDAETERLNQALRLVEAELVNSFKVSATVDFENSAIQLGYGKLGGNWQLFIQDGADRTPLLSASRERRVKAVDRLCALRVRLDDVSQAVVREVMHAADEASRIASVWKSWRMP